MTPRYLQIAPGSGLDQCLHLEQGLFVALFRPPGKKPAEWPEADNYCVYVHQGDCQWEWDRTPMEFKVPRAAFLTREQLTTLQMDGSFLALVIGISNDRIKKTMEGHLDPGGYKRQSEALRSPSRLDLNNGTALQPFFHGILEYFGTLKPVPREIWSHKIEEMLLLLWADASNHRLRAHFAWLQQCSRYSIQHVMESYYMYPMNMEEFARLCARSLSTFRAEFQEIYGATPGKWLVQQRLKLSYEQIKATDKSITDIAFDSGFKNLSHFARIFKSTFGLSPSALRKQDSS